MSNNDIIPTKVVMVNPIDNLFSINWRFDIRCNYDCSYCDKDWHSLNSTPIGLDKLVEQWNKLYPMAQGRKIKLSFFGGEPTANKNFLPLVQYIFANYKDDIGLCGFSTNGSAPYKVYEKLIGFMDYISFSIHSEFFNEKDFFNKIKAIKMLTANTNKRINVSIMDESWNRNRFGAYKKWLTEHGIDYKVSMIDWDHAIRLIPVENKRNEQYDFENHL